MTDQPRETGRGRPKTLDDVGCLSRDGLAALSSVTTLMKREASFRDENGSLWGIGRNGDVWVEQCV